MQQLKYIQGYPAHLVDQVQQLIDKDQLKTLLLNRYPTPHTIKTEKALYDYVIEVKNQYLKKSAPLSKVRYDDKIDVIHNALGLHTQYSRIQGNKLKAKREIRVGSVFKKAPQAFLDMIIVHELAHLKERDHNRAFYNLCRHMLNDYHQIELDLRLYLTYLMLNGALYDTQ